MTADTTTADAYANGQREAREADRVALVDALHLPPETLWEDAVNAAAAYPGALQESRSAEEYQRLVNALLCKPTEVAPLSNQDQSDSRVAVRSTLMVMAIKLMAAAVRNNPDAKNYGSWKVSANPDALHPAEPGSPEDIDGWDIHVACVRPGGKGPSELCAERTKERDDARKDAARIVRSRAAMLPRGEPRMQLLIAAACISPGSPDEQDPPTVNTPKE